MEIPSPNFTQTPNICFDEIFKKLKEGELRVILVIIRQTFGWHKQYDRISLSQVAEKSGMERSSVCRSLNSLIKNGLVEKKKFGDPGTERCYYRLRMEYVESEKLSHDDGIESEEEMQLISNNSYQCSKDTPPVSNTPPPSVETTHTKETLTKENKQNKQQQAAQPAAVCSKNKIKSLECLEKVDIPENDKIEISSRYTEKIVQNAIEWATNPKNPPSKCLAASIKYACKNGLSSQEFYKKKETAFEMVCRLFNHGKKYNGAECFLNQESISFHRGERHETVKFNQYFTFSKLHDLCQSFKIPVPKMA